MIEQQDLKGMEEMILPPGRVLCRRLQVAKTAGGIVLPQTTVVGKGRYLVLRVADSIGEDDELPPIFRKYLMAGAIIAGTDYVGIPLVDGSSTYFLLESADIHGLFPVDSMQVEDIRKTHTVANELS
jgi:co-chaperonin GroES (HSP10)